ncbi:MAG: type II toxin-antitoxin system prevent-host-death family antitoxin [Sphingomonas sp.]
MEMTTITSREFNQDASGAKRRADCGPVFITDRGQPAHVLLTIAEYNRLAGKGKSVAESLAQTGPGGDFDYDFSQFRSRELAREIDFGAD